jgi:hypothetical protein
VGAIRRCARIDDCHYEIPDFMEKSLECVERRLLPDRVQQLGMWLDARGRYIGLYAADTDAPPDDAARW